MNALELKQVSKHYPGFDLENLTLSLPGGCILGLIGENGAGKSTTIRLMLGACTAGHRFHHSAGPGHWR